MGSVYIFEKNALNKWVGVQKLRASNASLNHLHFGDNLQLYDNQIAVSGFEYGRNSSGAITALFGNIYMFEKVTGSIWKEYQIIEEKVKHNSDSFGRFMSLSEDNLFAGAYWNSYDSNDQNFINDSGAIYVFNTYDQSTFTKPSLKTVPVFESCANLGNGFSSNFDLSTIESDLVANPQECKFYYKDQLGNTLPSPLPKNYSNTVPYSEKITIRVENRHNSTCYDEIEIELKTIPSFEVHTITPLYACDTNSSGFGFFDLSNLKSSLVEDAPLYDFLFFDGKGKDISPLIDESYQNSNKNFEELLVKITDKRTLCSREIKVPLFISTIVAHQIPTLFSCVKNNLGMAQFDTSKIEEQILQGQKNVIIKYYDENNLQLNSLPNPYFVKFGTVKEIKATTEDLLLGCYDDVSILFNSKDCNEAALQLEILNYFTPNGDGYNDNWSVIANSAEIKFNVSVFDRFGKLLTVLENTDPWDGTYQGIEMPSSDYWYLIKEQNGKEHRGHFTLKR
jgi:gliding motility-associated-like protein